MITNSLFLAFYRGLLWMFQTGAGCRRKIVITFRRNRVWQECHISISTKIFQLRCIQQQACKIRTTSAYAAVGCVALLTKYYCSPEKYGQSCVTTCVGVSAGMCEQLTTLALGVSVRRRSMYCVKCLSRPTTQVRITNKNYYKCVTNCRHCNAISPVVFAYQVYLFFSSMIGFVCWWANWTVWRDAAKGWVKFTNQLLELEWIIQWISKDTVSKGRIGHSYGDVKRGFFPLHRR